MDKDGSITHSRDIRMTPHALSSTPPHREAEERSPPRLPIVELGPTESDADDELGRETATEGQPVAGGAGETGDLPATPEPPAKVQKTAPRVQAQDRWAMVPMVEPDPEPFEGPPSSSGRPLRPSKRLAMLASDMADVLGCGWLKPARSKIRH